VYCGIRETIARILAIRSAGSTCPKQILIIHQHPDFSFHLGYFQHGNPVKATGWDRHTPWTIKGDLYLRARVGHRENIITSNKVTSDARLLPCVTGAICYRAYQTRLRRAGGRKWKFFLFYAKKGFYRHRPDTNDSSILPGPWMEGSPGRRR